MTEALKILFDKPLCVFDIETDDLLDNCTKIHVVSACIVKTDGSKWKVTSTGDLSKMRELFSQDFIFIGHNISRFDNLIIKKFFNIEIHNWIDTLGLSWYLEPERRNHGLEKYGDDLGIEKPEIKDWENLTYEEYAFRCSEDVKINVTLFLSQINEIWRLYRNKEAVLKLLHYLKFKLDCAVEALEKKWELDIEHCDSTLYLMEQEKVKKFFELEQVMPDIPVYATRNYPKVFYKKDGGLSANGKKWLNLLDEYGLPDDYKEPIEVVTKYKKPNAGSVQQLKKFLFKEGWKPCTYNFVKDDKIEGGFRKVEQIYNDKKQVCDSIVLMYDRIPELKALEGLSVVKHRIGVLKGFLKNVDKEGYVKAEIQGFTNTMRFKHKVVVNLPGVTKNRDWKDGWHIRKCLKASEGTILIGSDMSGLEDRTKHHYMFHHDPDYVKTMMSSSYDPHLDIAVVAHNMGIEVASMSQQEADEYKRIKKKAKLHRQDPKNNPKTTKEEDRVFSNLNGPRQQAKVLNYSCVYGAGGKSVARSLGIAERVGRQLVNAYRERNWAIQAVAEEQIVKEVGDKKWLLNPINGFFYYLKEEKDIFSTLNQGSGVYCFDMWIYFILYLRSRHSVKFDLIGQMHDEVILRCDKGDEREVAKILEKAIEMANNHLSLNRDLGISIEFGEDYSEIH